jgi:hypothetical protein
LRRILPLLFAYSHKHSANPTPHFTIVSQTSTLRQQFLNTSPLPEYSIIIVPSQICETSPNSNRQAIQSWSEEFKAQLASGSGGGGGGSDGEEDAGGGEGEEDDADEARALLDFAEAIEHR